MQKHAPSSRARQAARSALSARERSPRAAGHPIEPARRARNAGRGSTRAGSAAPGVRIECASLASGARPQAPTGARGGGQRVRSKKDSQQSAEMSSTEGLTAGTWDSLMASTAVERYAPILCLVSPRRGSISGALELDPPDAQHRRGSERDKLASKSPATGPSKQ